MRCQKKRLHLDLFHAYEIAPVPRAASAGKVKYALTRRQQGSIVRYTLTARWELGALSGDSSISLWSLS